MIFDLEHIGDNYGEYFPESDHITIYCAKIYQICKLENVISEQYVISKTIETIIHETYHQAIDPCLENPEEYDEHKIFKYLYG